MDIQILKDDKNDMELVVNNSTISEVLRAYLSLDGVDFVAWRKDHPSKPAIFKIKSSGKTVVKAVGDAVEAIKKDCSEILKEVKK